jgi:hypothetical protein
MTITNRAITVYCASSPEAPEEFVNCAYELGREAALRGFNTVTGAGAAGLMGAVVSGTLAGGADAIGVIPRFMVERGWQNPRMTECHVVEDMHRRKALLAQLGCGAVALPGGIGTLDELMELLALRQLGQYHHPVVILNLNGFYDSLLAQFAHADSHSMMRHTGLEGRHWEVALTPAEAVDIIEKHLK